MKAVFFDFENVLFEWINNEWVYRKEIEPLLLKDPEIAKGILCNLPKGLTPADVKLMLKSQAAEALFSPGLFIFPELLGITLPDRRAFAVAAVIAGVPLNEVGYVTTKHQLLQPQVAGDPVIIPYRQPSQPGLLAEGERPATESNSYILQGRIATMDNEAVIEKGSIVVKDGIIAEILEDAEIPAQFNELPVIDTGSTLFPGFIDLHNHYPYNIITLWNVPKKYNNRSVWFREVSYKSGVSMPVKMMAGYTPTAKSIARFVEAKAILGGTCTGQGIARNKGGGIKMYRGAMRNVESSGNENLPEVNAQVLDLKITETTEIEKFRRNLNRYSAMFYHLSEGTDESSRKRFLELKSNNLLKPALVGIHSLALQQQDIEAMASAQSKIVWSPFSNLLLYGATLQLQPLIDSGILFSIGCDWSPSGGKNLLTELKVARFVVDMQEVDISNFRLIEMITNNAAQVLGWQEHLGKLAPGFIADIVAVKGTEDDPYDQLVQATEKDIRLVIIDGIARYGDLDVMQELYGDSKQIEKFTVQNTKKAFHLFAEDSSLNDLSLSSAVDTLKEAMSDLPGLQKEIQNPKPSLLAVQEEFTLALDMEDEEETIADPELFAAAQLPKSIELDRLSVESTDLDMISQQGNLPDGLADFVKKSF